MKRVSHQNVHSPRFLILKNQTTAEYQRLPHENQIKWPGVRCSEGAPGSFIWSHKDASIAINAVLDFLRSQEWGGALHP